MLMDTFGDYLTQILPAKCLENMKNFRQKYVCLEFMKNFRQKYICLENMENFRQKYVCLENMKNFRQKYILKTSTGDVSDVDVLPQWEEIHISLEAEFLGEDICTFFGNGHSDSLKVMEIEGVASRKVLAKFARKCREVAWEALLRHPIPQLGGPGVIIQIDESKFNYKSKVGTQHDPKYQGCLERWPNTTRVTRVT